MKNKTKDLLTTYNKGKQRRSRSTFRDILKAATLILERHPQNFTTNKVAAMAGISIGHLYQFFPNKEAILDALFEQEFEKDQNIIESIIREAGPVNTIEAIELVIQMITKINQRSSRLRKVMWANIGRSNRLSLMKEMHQRNIYQVGNFFRSCNDWNPHRDPLMLSLIMLSSYMSVLNTNNELKLFTDESLIKELHRLYTLQSS